MEPRQTRKKHRRYHLPRISNRPINSYSTYRVSSILTQPTSLRLMLPLQNLPNLQLRIMRHRHSELGSGNRLYNYPNIRVRLHRAHRLPPQPKRPANPIIPVSLGRNTTQPQANINSQRFRHSKFIVNCQRPVRQKFSRLRNHMPRSITRNRRQHSYDNSRISMASIRPFPMRSLVQLAKRITITNRIKLPSKGHLNRPTAKFSVPVRGVSRHQSTNLTARMKLRSNHQYDRPQRHRQYTIQRRSRNTQVNLTSHLSRDIILDQRIRIQTIRALALMDTKGANRSRHRIKLPNGKRNLHSRTIITPNNR